MAAYKKPTHVSRGGFLDFKTLGRTLVADLVDRGFDVVYPTFVPVIDDTGNAHPLPDPIDKAILKPRVPGNSDTNTFSVDPLADSQPWSICIDYTDPIDMSLGEGKNDTGSIRLYVATPLQFMEDGTVAIERSYLKSDNSKYYERRSGEITCGWYVDSAGDGVDGKDKFSKDGKPIPEITDDHGNTFLNATTVLTQSQTLGTLTSGDIDMFTFTAEDDGEIQIQVLCNFQIAASLYMGQDYPEHAVYYNDKLDFYRIRQNIGKGQQFYLALTNYYDKGQGGDYTLNIQLIIPKKDDKGNVITSDTTNKAQTQFFPEEVLDSMAFQQRLQQLQTAALQKSTRGFIGPGGIQITGEGQYTIPFASRFWAKTNASDLVESDFATLTYSYKLVTSYQGIALCIWQEGQDPFGNKFSWIVIQRPVSPTNGVILTVGKCPVVCVYSIGGGEPLDPIFNDFLGNARNWWKRYHDSYIFNPAIYYFIVREADVTRPSIPALATVDSNDHKAFINGKEQVAHIESAKYTISFPKNFNTARFRYKEELDMFAYTSADVLSHVNTLSVTMYGENASRQYTAMLSNLPNNRGMRILFVTYAPGFDLPTTQSPTGVPAPAPPASVI